ncbi:aldose 1-epimerase family protein [soil metagenome]
MGIIQLDNGILRIAINSLGAELSSIVDVDGNELLWQAGDVWKRHAPLLFPIVGKMPGNVLEHHGVAYPIGQHGFARDLEFEVHPIDDVSCSFVLKDSDATRTHFPFAFELRATFVLDGNTIVETYEVTNLSTEAFSASLGGHPAFKWPLVEGVAREAHTLEFAFDEPASIRRLEDGLVRFEPLETPVDGRMLPLRDDLFVDDAIIFDKLLSRSVRYSAPGTPSITVSFDDFPLLGVWSKLPGDFVCIEPWFGMTAPVGFSGEYSAKPGQFELEPDASRSFTYSVSIGH